MGRTSFPHLRLNATVQPASVPSLLYPASASGRPARDPGSCQNLRICFPMEPFSGHGLVLQRARLRHLHLFTPRDSAAFLHESVCGCTLLPQGASAPGHSSPCLQSELIRPHLGRKDDAYRGRRLVGEWGGESRRLRSIRGHGRASAPAKRGKARTRDHLTFKKKKKKNLEIRTFI